MSQTQTISKSRLCKNILIRIFRKCPDKWFTIDELLQILHKHNFDFTYGHVYYALKQLVNEGLVIRRGLKPIQYRLNNHVLKVNKS